MKRASGMSQSRRAWCGRSNMLLQAGPWTVFSFGERVWWSSDVLQQVCKVEPGQRRRTFWVDVDDWMAGGCRRTPGHQAIPNISLVANDRAIGIGSARPREEVQKEAVAVSIEEIL